MFVDAEAFCRYDLIRKNLYPRCKLGVKRLKRNAKLVKSGRTGANRLAREMQRYGGIYPEFCVNVLRECKQQKLV